MGYLKRHNASREQFDLEPGQHKLVPMPVQHTSSLSLAGEFLLLICLLTFSSIYVHNLEL